MKYRRIIRVSDDRSYFLFGARSTGKTTFLHNKYSKENAYFIDLLDPDLYEELLAYPKHLEEICALPIKEGKTIIIDEVQRVPELLNVVHRLIFKYQAKFILTGSSARKLKRGAANMLSGRASIYNLSPLLFSELEESFSLESALKWGTLPEINLLENNLDKLEYLDSYCRSYIQEEIIAEQIIRKLPPFKRFLDISSQMNSKIINASKIARDINTSTSNVNNYFEIIEDTLLGFKLLPFSQSVRKRQRKSPKFYWFDTGVVRALQKNLESDIREGTSYYGEVFESFIITQIKAGLDCQTGQYELSYLMTEKGAEIDLIIERANKKILCIEIRSSKKVRKESLNNLKNLSNEISNSKAVCFYNGDKKLLIDNIEVYPWRVGMRELSLIPNTIKKLEFKFF